MDGKRRVAWEGLGVLSWRTWIILLNIIFNIRSPDELGRLKFAYEQIKWPIGPTLFSGFCSMTKYIYPTPSP